MYAISTSAFFFILALASSLVVVQAGNPRPACSQKYTVVAGVTTCNTLIKKYNLSSHAQLQKINPGKTINCNAPLPAEILCVAMATPNCGTKVTASEGSCSKFLAQHSLTKEQLFEYNDDVNLECTNFKKGNSYCVALMIVH